MMPMRLRYTPVAHVSKRAERDNLHGGLQDKDGREEVVEDLQRELQLLQGTVKTTWVSDS